MPKLGTKGGSARIDTVPLPEVVSRGGKYYLKVGSRQMEIPVGPLTHEADIRKLVGKNVNVIYSDTPPKQIVAITQGKRPPFVCVLCYIGPPDVFGKISPAIRQAFVREMVKARVISPKIGRSLKFKR